MHWLRVFFINLLVLFACFLVVEIVFQILHPGYIYYEQTYLDKFATSTQIKKVNSNWVKADSDLGWVCQEGPYLQFYDSAYANIVYQINPQGFRNSTSFDSLPKKNKRRILLIGDSFLFGIFLKENQTVAHHLQNQLGEEAEVYNLSVPAWGLDQMYLAYQKYAEIIQADQVILFYIDDDIARLAEAFYWGVGIKPVFRLEDHQLVERGGEEGKLNALQSYFCFNSKVINHLYQQDCLNACSPIAAHIFDQMIEAEGERGRTLMVFRYPRIQQVADHSSTVPFDHQAYFSKSKAQFVDLNDWLVEKGTSTYPQLYLPKDGHPSARGTQEISLYLYHLLQDQE